ncbi:MAG TPA: GNAT family N-acetyltransferase [Planctomycetes bacterium]|nr:GNAT family N-acetyltransferase [Planctomycetota bacterium]HIK61012.1 GNAT family N-acetyltransferase [Planctomycetota bacterium]
MNVSLTLHEKPCDWADLITDLDRYVTRLTAEWTDRDPGEGLGAALLRRADESSAGLLLTAHASEPDSPKGARLGYCVIVPLADPVTGMETPFIAALEVDRNYRHRGLARSMVSAVTAEMKRRGHPELAARAGHNDDALISMGERWGFVRSHEVMVLQP